ncbi:hypothetical protein AUC68_08580 [Methyloceanibacter methanicus]|uniref:Uncharacterized protein n=1 Tax=Methyloceanibacter methanicus TaxID=1774968 RepID=A0A1E3VZZ2_9HYPH|nr:hypothetical protein [Methyloceanibacter methanicus]ODR98476.1 hypothetical protein AUC68_08580 [Methyloceanibacter methanicus]
MLKQVLLFWLSTRELPTEAKAVGAFLIWSADERSWRVNGLPVRKVADFTGRPAGRVETMIDCLKEHYVIAHGEVRANTINCQLDALHMARSCGIRLAEAGYRTDSEIVWHHVDARSPELEARMQTVIPFPLRP